MDDGSLIEQVRKCSVLYNKNDGRFKSKAARDQAWDKIAMTLHYPAKICEQRWCVLRNRYTTLKRKIRTTPPELGTLTITWPYYDSMKFLDPFLSTRRSRVVDHIIVPPGVISEEIVEMTMSEYSGSENETEEAENSMMSTGEFSEIDQKNVIPNPTKPPTQNESFQKPKYNFFKNAVQMMEDPLVTHHQDDQHFVKSLVSDMSVFSKEERILLKRKFYDVMADFLEEKINKNQ